MKKKEEPKKLWKKIALFSGLFLMSLLIIVQPWYFAGKVIVEAFLLMVGDYIFDTI